MAFRNWRFRSVLSVVVSIVAILPLLIFGGIELYRKAGQVKASHDEQMSFLLSRLEVETKNNLDRFVFSADSAGKILLETKTENSNILDRLLASYHQNHGIEIFAMLDRAGKVRNLYNPNNFKSLARDSKFKIRVERVIRQKETYVGVFRDKESDGGRSPVFLHPIISLTGDLQGVLIGKFKLGILQHILGDQQNWSNSINYFLISEDKDVIVAKNTKIYGDAKPIIDYFLNNGVGDRKIVDVSIEGEGVRGVVLNIDAKMGWKYVLFYSDREVHSEYLLMWLSFVSTIVFAISFGVVIAIAISRRIAKPVLDAVKMMRSLKAKNFGRVIETDVDVYSKELQELIDAIKDMSREISHYTLNLEETVEKRTISLRVLTDELKKKNQQLLDANQLKNQFLAMAAHDLRNPIGVIRGYADFLAEEMAEANNVDNKEILEKCRVLCDFMIDLLNELLDISQIESGKINLKLEDIDCNSLIEGVVAMHRSYAEKKKIELQFNGYADLPKIQIDSRRMEQVLDNLISNAIKYSFENSKVIVDITMSTKEIIISVKDQGQGIKDSELSKLFKPFSRTSSQTTGGERSTGLGLAIVAKLIQEHKGRVWVESSWGYGATFFIALPIQRASGQHAA